MKGNKRLIGKLIAGLAVMLMLGGLYLASLLVTPRWQLPRLMGKSSIDLNVLDDAQDKRDRIQIAKLGIEVPFFGGTDVKLLEKGAWHRFPERGDPVKGGNFILSAHRFHLGLTPQGTRTRSPFYNLNKLAPGDDIKVFFQGQTYTYQVTRRYKIKPNQVSIEAPSTEAKMTLYSCTMAGPQDGREVIEAKPT